MNLKRNLLLILVLGMCTLLLFGCGGETPVDPSAGGDADAPKVLRFTKSWTDPAWDPAAFGEANGVELAMVIYEPLTRLDEQGNVGPCLAESWKVSDDGLSVTYTLRKGVQWHFGYGEFTSADVKFSLERHNDPDVSSRNIQNLNLENVASIDTPDAYTVVLNLKNPDADVLTRLSILPAGYMVSKAYFDEVGLAGLGAKPVGTGSFIYESGSPETVTEAVRFDEYWGEAAALDKIVVSVITDPNTGFAALENGELEALGVFDIDKALEYKAKGFNTHPVVSLELLYVSSNMQLAPFDNAKVREAMFAAMDPQYFIDEMFYGTTEVPGGYVPAGAKYAVDNYFKSTYDPARAKELLAEAGYPDGVTVTLWAPNDALSKTPAIITQSQLAQAGFNVELQLVDFGVFIDKVRNGEAQMWLLFNTTPAIADETIKRYTSEFYPGKNWSGIVDDEYDRLVAAGLSAETEAEKADYLAQAQKRFMDLQVVYPISTQAYHFVTQPNVGGHYVDVEGKVHLEKMFVE